MYLHDTLLRSSFDRLASRSAKGKRPLERTSALMYFLAMDAAAKKLNATPLDLNFQSNDGKQHRDTMQLEFCRLVRLHKSASGKLRQILKLGHVTTGGNEPEKRISSNFYTTPVKKASQTSKKIGYPNRPASLLTLGQGLTGLPWGVGYHPNWETNLPQFFTDFKSNVPFTDLAIFVLRDYVFPEDATDLRSELGAALALRFSASLTDCWVGKMNSEKRFFRDGEPHFQAEAPTAFKDDGREQPSTVSGVAELRALGEDALVNRVVYLEGLLEENEIQFEKI